MDTTNFNKIFNNAVLYISRRDNNIRNFIHTGKMQNLSDKFGVSICELYINKFIIQLKTYENVIFGNNLGVTPHPTNIKHITNFIKFVTECGIKYRVEIDAKYMLKYGYNIHINHNCVTLWDLYIMKMDTEFCKSVELLLNMEENNMSNTTNNENYKIKLNDSDVITVRREISLLNLTKPQSCPVRVRQRFMEDIQLLEDALFNRLASSTFGCTVESFSIFLETVLRISINKGIKLDGYTLINRMYKLTQVRDNPTESLNLTQFYNKYDNLRYTNIMMKLVSTCLTSDELDCYGFRANVNVVDELPFVVIDNSIREDIINRECAIQSPSDTNDSTAEDTNDNDTHNITKQSVKPIENGKIFGSRPIKIEYNKLTIYGRDLVKRLVNDLDMMVNVDELKESKIIFDSNKFISDTIDYMKENKYLSGVPMFVADVPMFVECNVCNPPIMTFNQLLHKSVEWYMEDLGISKDSIDNKKLLREYFDKFEENLDNLLTELKTERAKWDND